LSELLACMRQALIILCTTSCLGGLPIYSSVAAVMLLGASSGHATIPAPITPLVGRVELGAPKETADATVACMYPMTGRSASYGRDSIVGIKLALEELAADPDSPRLRVIVDDSRSKSSFAVRMAEDFIRQDHADILCGMVSSGVGMAVSRLAKNHFDRHRSRLLEGHPRGGP